MLARVVECLSILFEAVLIVLVGNILLAHLLSMKDERKRASGNEIAMRSIFFLRELMKSGQEGNVTIIIFSFSSLFVPLA
jgi:hypothetical protein